MVNPFVCLIHINLKSCWKQDTGWMDLGLSHSDNSYISMAKFYKYTLAEYVMLKKKSIYKV